jgi:hypothetical protein
VRWQSQAHQSRPDKEFMMEASELLNELQRTRFFGSLELKFEAGRVVLVRKTETLKPQDCRNNRGEQDEHEPSR